MRFYIPNVYIINSYFAAFKTSIWIKISVVCENVHVCVCVCACVFYIYTVCYFLKIAFLCFVELIQRKGIWSCLAVSCSSKIFCKYIFDTVNLYIIQKNGMTIETTLHQQIWSRSTAPNRCDQSVLVRTSEKAGCTSATNASVSLLCICTVIWWGDHTFLWFMWPLTKIRLKPLILNLQWTSRAFFWNVGSDWNPEHQKCEALTTQPRCWPLYPNNWTTSLHS